MQAVGRGTFLHHGEARIEPVRPADYASDRAIVRLGGYAQPTNSLRVDAYDHARLNQSRSFDLEWLCPPAADEAG
jgi:hypothetical protein